MNTCFWQPNGKLDCYLNDSSNPSVKEAFMNYNTGNYLQNMAQSIPVSLPKFDVFKENIIPYDHSLYSSYSYNK